MGLVVAFERSAKAIPEASRVQVAWSVQPASRCDYAPINVSGNIALGQTMPDAMFFDGMKGSTARVIRLTERNVMRAYIDIKGVAVDRHELTDKELREIGEFTRENVLKWLKAWLRKDSNWDALNYFEDDDFHAVCGDIDIPWANEETKRKWDQRFPQGWDYSH